MQNGATVVYVNGIFATSSEASTDLTKLQSKYIEKTGDSKTKFINGFNPSHIGGIGDLLKSIEQAYQGEGSFITDTDLVTILLQIHPQVTTQKILLVGHSQGTYYTNALYGYLTDHGVSKNSIAVYNVATPASFVAGEGQYLTSATDNVINKVRSAIKSAPSKEGFGAGVALATVKQTRPKDPLPANTTFALTSAEAGTEKGGHAFSAVYLEYAPNTIVSAITQSIGRLTTSTDSKGDCFTPPSESSAYKASKVSLDVVDLVVAKATPALAFVKDFAVDVGQKVPSNLASAISSLVKTITPEPRTQNLPGSHSIVSALYGSSMTEKDLKELLGNQGGAVALAVQAPAPKVISVPPKPVGEVKGVETQKPTVPTGPLIPPPPPVVGGGISPGFGGGGGSSPKKSPPAPSAHTATITYTFTATDSNGVTTECSFDSDPPVTCDGSFSQNLGPGDHTFTVTATDSVGNQTTQTRHFNVLP